MDAFDIALRDLRACYGDKGIFAGLHHFKDYWARDSFFASLGALAAGDNDIVRKSLELFLEAERRGQLPLRVGRKMHEVHLGYKKRRPIYTTDKNEHHSTDQNSLFIICLAEYVKKNGSGLVEKNIDKIKRIMDWNFTQDKDGDLLIEEGPYCSWADSIRKKGKVLYTNTCHIHAMKCMVELGFKDYQQKHAAAKKLLNEIFWSGEHYQDWIDGDRHYNYFSTDGNMLAILWGLADKAKAKHIEEASHIFDLHDVPSRCVHPDYPKSYAYFPLKLIGLGDYHNGLSWIWLGSINALAKYRIGMKEEARELMEKISELIERFGTVYEVYGKDGKPVKRLIYRSERPFAWSSGLFVYAHTEIYGKK
jgi:glycogen debranching enzyme